MLQSFLGVLWLCTPSVMSSQAKEFVGVLTGDDKLTVFADGNFVGENSGYWNDARWLSFSRKTKLIAVSITNIPGGNSGFLGVFSNGVVTDASWKCKETRNPESGWEQTNFNDGAWPKAYIRNDNSVIKVYGIPSNVHWISPANHLANGFICRRRLSTEEKSSNNSLISILGRSPKYTISLYLDGVFTAKAVGELTVIKDQHNLQAVQVNDSSVSDVKFLASSSNGIKTNYLWRCTNVYHEGWFLTEYNDSFWPKVFVSGDNEYCRFIAPDAKWIGYAWAASNKIYCRQNANKDPVFRIPHGTPSVDLETPLTALVAQTTAIYTTNSKDFSTKVIKPSPATKFTRGTFSTAASNPPRTSTVSESSSRNTKKLSTLVIVVITVSGVTAVIIGLSSSCFIWRKLRNRRENGTKELQKTNLTNDKWEIKSDDVTVCEELGHGAFGKVFKGILKTSSCINRGSTVQQTSKKKIKSSRTVAVKMLQENATPDQKNDFLDEINLMKAVGSHKNIVSLIGCCTKSSPNFLLVEFASQGDLLSYLREIRKKVKDSKATYVQVRGSPPPISTKSNQERPDGHEVNTEIGLANVAFSKADSSIKIKTKSMQYSNDEEQDQHEEHSFLSKDMMSFSWQIAQGMEYLSGKGIVHRDLAARNVLVYDDKLVKVSDFGLARSTLEENVYHMTGQHNKLPIKWMSPEAINNGVFTTKSDVWSYGIVLWEVTTLGGFPYPGIKNSELMRLLKRGYRMEKPDTCSEEFYQLMTRCWADNPNVRPTFTKLCQDLEDWMQQDTPYLDMEQVDKDQAYYDSSAVPASSGSSFAELACETPELNCRL